MANILVYIELSADRPAPASLEALGEGRRLASFLGATLYAILPCKTPPRYGNDDAIAILSRHGADKVILTGGPAPGVPSLYVTHGHSLMAAIERVPAALVVLAATSGGRDLAPRAAARLGAAYMPEPTVEYGEPGELTLSRLVYGGGFRRRLAAGDLERPVVITVAPGAARAGLGDEEAEVIHITDFGVTPDVKEVSRADDAGAALETAQVIVTAGGGVSDADYALVRELARALGGEVAVTRAAVERGLDSADREVGVGGRRVAPRLYVVCGASGSAEHLAAVAPEAQIVAINRDPDAPIFRKATWGLVGELADLLPALAAAVAP